MKNEFLQEFDHELMFFLLIISRISNITFLFFRDL